MFRVLCAVVLCVVSLSTICVKAIDPGCRYTTEEYKYHPKYGCKPKDAGQFRDCQYCNKFVLCGSGQTHPMTCPTDSRMYFNGLVCTADPKGEQCKTEYYEDTTVTLKTTTYSNVPICPTAGCCIQDCKGRVNGDYGYCGSCHRFATCSNGILHLRKCPANLVWDDVLKRCEYVSGTCYLGCYTQNVAAVYCRYYFEVETKLQSCESCSQFFQCTAAYPYYVEIECGYGKYFDSTEKKCVSDSTTCTKDCKAIEYGYCNPSTFETYHLCSGCNFYASCNYNQVKIGVCYEGLVWDNMKQDCIPRELSQTCGNLIINPSRCEIISCYSEKDSDFTTCRYLDNNRYILGFVVHRDHYGYSSCNFGYTWKIQLSKQGTPVIYLKDSCCMTFLICKADPALGGGK